MNGNDTPPDDPTAPEEVGGFQFGMTDGAGDSTEDPPTRTDGAGSAGGRFDFLSWLGDTLRNFEEKAAPTDSVESQSSTTTVGLSDFLGFDFSTWLDETEVETPTETESVDSEAESAELGPVYAGFNFRQWVAAAEESGPKKPPDVARAVGATQQESRVLRARVTSLLPFVGGATDEDTYPGGFEFDKWLGDGDSEFFDAVEVAEESEPEPEPVETETIVDEQPEFPSPPGGGIADSPPLKLALFALFAASLVAVGLSAAGAVAPLGPADGFSTPAVADDTEEQPVTTATPTPTPTPEPTATPTPEPTPTPTPTPTPEDDNGTIFDPLVG